MAIGDGANDVAMIQEAHVGVAISGREGQAAVKSSDYSIAKFKFLKNLLLVHGRRNYRRSSFVILYQFYKNFVLVFPLFYFSFYNAGSGTCLYDSWLIMSYNTLFASLPVIALGALD